MGCAAQERIASGSKTLPRKGLLRMDAKLMVTCDPTFLERICGCARRTILGNNAKPNLTAERDWSKD